MRKQGLETRRRSLPSRARSMAVPGVLAIVVTLSATYPTVIGDSAPAAAAACTPGSVRVTPDAGLDTLFQSYGNSGTGTSWTGGDGTESVALPDGRELWMFDDSLLGKVKNGQRSRKGAAYIHNAFVIEANGTLTTTLYTHGRKPSAFVNPSARRAFSLGFFPGGSVINGGSLQVLMTEVKFHRNSHKKFNFVDVRDFVGTFSLPSLGLVGVVPLPLSGINWTEGVLSDAGYTYIYGTGSGNVYVARVPGSDLTASWTYFSGTGWTPAASAATPIENSVQAEAHLSVSRITGAFGVGYALVYMPSLGSTRVTTAFGCSPVGPFGPPQAIYTTPEPSQYPPIDGVITYGAHAHPELSSSPNTLVISYDVDPVGRKGLSVRDASIYRPRFIDVTFS